MRRIFHRPQLAFDLATQLLSPGVLEQGLRSGLFLSGPWRTGKTTFLLHDMKPALEDRGALALYVNLWSDASAEPSTLIYSALRSALTEMQTATGTHQSGVHRLRNQGVCTARFTFGFPIADLGTPTGATVAQVATEIVDQAKTDLVFIVDEVQHMLTSKAGLALLHGFKAARDAVNARVNSPGHFIFMGAGSDHAQILDMTMQSRAAFLGATSFDYPTLGEDYVQYVLQWIVEDGNIVVPSLPVASESFALLGRRPADLLRALRTLQQFQPHEANRYLPVIANTLRQSDADITIKKIEELGVLGCAVFDHAAQADEGATGLFSAAAIECYSSAVGREVTIEEVQVIAQLLQDSSIIVRRGYGRHAVTDQFVRETWRRRIAALKPAHCEPKVQ
ncbi:ATP-binding protein [Acidovorax sp.]|uniref:ATP-binding protein n=1 Tax=Acidovorax sp. TaxID=1872122 RepID=UPI0025C04741|nr:ATP-binding protein [Acidovorax sp.]